MKNKSLFGNLTLLILVASATNIQALNIVLWNWTRANLQVLAYKSPNNQNEIKNGIGGWNRSDHIVDSAYGMPLDLVIAPVSGDTPHHGFGNEICRLTLSEEDRNRSDIKDIAITIEEIKQYSEDLEVKYALKCRYEIWANNNERVYLGLKDTGIEYIHENKPMQYVSINSRYLTGYIIDAVESYRQKSSIEHRNMMCHGAMGRIC